MCQHLSVFDRNLLRTWWIQTRQDASRFERFTRFFSSFSQLYIDHAQPAHLLAYTTSPSSNILIMNQIPRATCLRQARFATLRGPLGHRYFASSFTARACLSKQSNKSNCQNTKSSPPGSSLSTFSRAFWACRSTWRRAGINTLRCLIGCTVGDFSTLWTLQSYYPELGMNTIMLASSASSPHPCQSTEQHAELYL